MKYVLVTGHSEVVRVIWNTDKIDIVFIENVLGMSWSNTKEQGNDIGTQYRSAIYYKNENNKKIILASKEQYQKELNNNNLGLIATEIKMIDTYYYAEQYHQQYLASPGSRQYCSAFLLKLS